MKDKRIIVIVGPTASGKTGIAIQLATELDGEIISADSRQFYQKMNIGTAKPTNIEMLMVRHHLINVADPAVPWSLAKFLVAAWECIRDIQSRAKTPFIVGGTGQYIWGLIEGWKIPSQPVNETLRKEIQDWAVELGPEGIHSVLSRLDPRAASFIQYENVRRTIRALEVIYGTGMRFSDQRLKNPPKEQFLILGIHWDRAELYRRVDSRIEVMLNTGLVEEVCQLLDLGLDPETSAMSAIGYREIVGYLQGNYDLDEAVTLIKRNTRQYIRRQANWFKIIDQRIRWFEPGEDLSERMLGYIQKSQAD